MAGSLLKCVPEIVTVVPIGPLDGEMPEIVGIWTVKSVLVVALPLLFVTVIGPVSASNLTFTCICVDVAETIGAFPVEPENLTVAVPNVLPFMVTMSPTTPLVGEKLLMTGRAATASNVMNDRATAHNAADRRNPFRIRFPLIVSGAE